MNAVKAVMLSKTTCQCEDDEDEEDDDQQAEYDSMLIEYAGDIVPALGKAVGGSTLAPYFAGLLPLFLCRLVRDFFN